MKKKITKTVTLLGILILSAAIGGGYAFYHIKNKAKSKSFMVQNGCWAFNPVMDLENKHQRALIAKIGLFALRESEVLYFVASQDSEGEPLSAENDYVLEGASLDARYWSFTLYGHDYFLIPNESKIYGFNLESIQYLPQDSTEITKPKNYQIHISSEPTGSNWLPCGNEDQFYITLRMYNPSATVYENPTAAKLPIIKKI